MSVFKKPPKHDELKAFNNKDSVLRPKYSILECLLISSLKLH